MTFEQTAHGVIQTTDIAIVGMAGRFPGAANYEEFWKNLVDGKTGITEVPKNRWDWQTYWGDPKTEKNRSNSKWGGFLDAVESFDADFFGLSVKEVERMDPQQRIMLEVAWSCFEDAGVRPSVLSGKKIGVFLGVFNFDYKELQEKSSQFSIEAHHSTGTASAIIPNRISYYFNFKGPSIPIDTACSSSLSAIHAAIQSLQSGECTWALAGGINLLLTPTRHISFSKTGMLSPTGSCKTFDDGADGYVRGEGAGLVLLKPLKQAMDDKNNIWGIIKGSAVNHGGRTYSLTYPNPEAQTEVIRSAQKIAGVTPETIGYIEAHGTGTPKGDPIEFKGLLDAFQSNDTGDNAARENYCGLGSVKTNLGHLEAAAGITGIMKVLLSMRYKHLPGLQNFAKLNHRISLEKSPFYLVTKLQRWKRLKDKENRTLPRRAGVSSFGFGGTNAHVILEEGPSTRESNAKAKSSPPYYVACISAKTNESLLQKKKDLVSWLENAVSSIHIADICKTLSEGREHFAKRIAIVAENTHDLLNKLNAFIKNGYTDGYCDGAVSDKKIPSLQQLFIETGEMVSSVLSSGKKIRPEEYYQKLIVLAELYSSGYEPAWEKPWFGSRGKIITLPTYPFTRKSHWIPQEEITEQNIYTKRPGLSMLHPLLGTNVSDFQQQRFVTFFSGDEFFVKHHIVKGEKILPAVACLEMVRAAVSESTKKIYPEHSLSLKNVIWAQPVWVKTDSVEVHIVISPETENTFSFEILTGKEDQATVCSKGIAQFNMDFEDGMLALEDLKQNCDSKIFTRDQCYRFFEGMDFNYGPSFQAIENVYVGKEKMLAKLKLPEAVTPMDEAFYLHPSMMDAALQVSLIACLGTNDEIEKLNTYLPFALDFVEIRKSTTSQMWALIESNSGSFDFVDGAPVRRFNINLCDGAGEVYMRMTGLSLKLVESDKFLTAQKKDTLLVTPAWKETGPTSNADFRGDVNRLVVLCDLHQSSLSSLEHQFPGVRFLSFDRGQANVAEHYCWVAERIFEEVKTLMRGSRSGHTLVQVVIKLTGGINLLSGIAGLFRTVFLENPTVIGQIIELSSDDKIVEILRENAAPGREHRIRYINGKRSVPAWREVTQHTANDKDEVPWKENGIYLISGGAGGLGFIFAKEIARQKKNVTLILVGRSPVSQAGQSAIEALQRSGTIVHYRQADVANEQSVAALIQYVQSNFGTLNGIIHSAGVVKDNFAIKKSKEEFSTVLSAKVLGSTYLDEATKEMPLDFFILFSSVVGALGNIGQIDYAAANAYLDAYAFYRNSLVKEGKRNGHTLSINWPLWKEGGMQLETETEKLMLERIRMSSLETDEGILALYRGMNSGASNILVAYGNVQSLKNMLFESSGTTAPSSVLPAEPIDFSLGKDEIPGSGIALEEKAIEFFKNLLSTTIKRAVEEIDEQAAMEQYGIDSIMVMQMTTRMEMIFGTLPKTLFFEFQNIKELTHYFLSNHVSKLEEILVSEKAPVKAGWKQTQPSSGPSAEHKAFHLNKIRVASDKKPQSSKASDEKLDSNVSSLDVAIIGVGGRYPKADTLREFWDNMKQGRDCITEIPKERWDYRLYFDDDKQKEGKSYSKWGGFINDVDKFDPMFFNITPLEAERMDPQERLFLQCVYESIEDAGYTRQTLAEKDHFGLTNLVGVYVGVMYEEYQLFGAQETLGGNPVALWGLPSSIANRVSYYCDFHGPSMAIDTMCSSSLTAIHLACESIVRGKCDVAIAGGVNVSIHPNKYLFLCQGRFASSKGRCESFGIGGDGYVPGEGVGAIVLKPLAKAIADGDNIYGVIKSTAVNHGGKTNGYTVPNPNAQASVIQRAFDEAGIDPRTISYLEAHGTGTSLGDPIEILGLSKTFNQHTTDRQFCSIGSAKSNIGHCESAAGIAGVTKVLLQLKHRQIVPSLHSKQLNENIDFFNSPFFVQQDLSPWKRPKIEKDGRHIEYPLRAGISSFGAGGANAHVVIEEYIPAVENAQAKHVTYDRDNHEPVMILLSARDKDQLMERAKQLLLVIREEINGSIDYATGKSLVDIGYTLQVGREHMESRLGMVVTSYADLERKLTTFLSDLKAGENMYYGEIGVFKKAGFSSEVVDTLVEEKNFSGITEYWTKGGNVNWKNLHRNLRRPVNRISLPTYPFRKDRYWIGEINKKIQQNERSLSFIHPFIHENISDLAGQRFKVVFSGEESFLTDHVVNGAKVVSAALFLEMIREAVWQSVKFSGRKVQDIQIRSISWIRPCIVNENGIALIVDLVANEDELVFKVTEKNDAEGDRIFCKGSISLSSLPEFPALTETQVSSLQAQCNLQTAHKDTCYRLFEKIGLTYGFTHQCLEKAFIGHNQILANATLRDNNSDDASLILHPGLVDSALQATLLMNWKGNDDSVKTFLPVAIEGIEIYRRTPEKALLLIMQKNVNEGTDVNQKIFSIEIFSEIGELCVRMTNVTLKASPVKEIAASSESVYKTLFLTPEWKNDVIRKNAPLKEFARTLIVICGMKNVTEELNSASPNTEILEVELSHDFLHLSGQIFERIKKLLKEKIKGSILIQILLPSTETGILYSAVAGMLKTARKENSKLYGQVIIVDDDRARLGLENILRENALHLEDDQVRYNMGIREVLELKTLDRPLAQKNENIPWKENGIYLITGGAGGLGLIIASEIVQKTKSATVVLTGRSPLDSEKQDKLDSLHRHGARIVYKQANIGVEGSVLELVQFIHDEFGELNGIIHSAGIIRDNFLINKTSAEWSEVLTPKVDGVRYLDMATGNDALDFFIFFSSVTGVAGNIGQADYATANAFLDRYAGYRNTLVKKGQRQGHTLSVNWPLWKDGGMHVDEVSEKYLFDSMGIVPLSTAEGIASLYTALSSERDQVMIVRGAEEVIHKTIVEKTFSNTDNVEAREQTDVADYGDVLVQSIQYFRNLLSAEVKIPVEKIKAEISFEEYGIDSVMIMKMTDKLEKIFGTLSKTLFFEYRNIRELASYFLEEHNISLYKVLEIKNEKDARPVEISSGGQVPFPKIKFNSHSRIFNHDKPSENRIEPLDIAIVGLSGKYPQAENLEEFWNNLSLGKNSITEIPETRWDYRLYFNADRNNAGTTYSKWGGFLNAVDEFDPLLFNISPMEAELMDPQERIFLQCAYETLEDAGYNRETLCAQGEKMLGGNVGVYVGVMYEEYQLFGAQESIQGRNIALFGNPSSIANRVSYFYNFNGPSMAIDTMCSSSLTAIHLACQSIWAGDCKAAIAGGVNISIHPNKYLLLAQGKFISSKGQCESFGIGGDGYVPGEGVGSVFLKPLSQAIADGDHVYGVIKATAVNHGGRTNGYTVPNPNAQAMVIKRAYQRSGVNPRTISYLEAHGTGTSLGDPIEIAGLKKAYQEYSNDSNYCAIGSVKSNIGHGESAAGIAGLTKVLLQLKHKTLVPSLHSQQLNPYIDFDNSPFVVQQNTAEWKRPVVEINGHKQEFLLRAGVSSFGAGGSNAHIIVEEFVEKIRDHAQVNDDTQKEQVIFLLSAKNEDRLKELVKRMQKAIQHGGFQDRDLPSIAFTLQTGRDALEARLAIVVDSIKKLSDKLLSFLGGELNVQDLYSGKIERDNNALDSFNSDEELREAIEKWIDRKKYNKLCEFWIKGLQIEWSRLHKTGLENRILRRISLPTYPFAKERYWVPQDGRNESKNILQTIPAIVKGNGANDSENTGSLENAQDAGVMVLRPVWIDKSSFDHNHSPANYNRVIILIDGLTFVNDVARLERLIPNVRILKFGIQSEGMAGRFRECVLFVFNEVKRLLQQTSGEKTLVQIVTPFDSILSSIFALLKSARLENPNITGQVIEVDRNTEEQSLISILSDNRSAETAHIRYHHGRRQISILEEYDTTAGMVSMPWKRDGVYLITGGIGGLGFVIAKEILQHVQKAIIILTGRSPLTEVTAARLSSLQNSEATVEYLQCDVFVKESISSVVELTQHRFGQLNGIIHCAGITRDSFILQKTEQELNEVLAPKVDGLVNLDEASKDVSLDFFVVFSSIAGVLGNAGQADYAAANAFMDAYAGLRNKLVDEHQRKGRTISINWPLWREGGMHVDSEVEKSMAKQIGLLPLQTVQALKAFYTMVFSGCDQLMLVYGNKNKLAEKLLRKEVKLQENRKSTAEVSTLSARQQEMLQEKTLERMKGIFSEVVKLDVSRIDEAELFYAYGLNSVMIVRLNNILEGVFGELSKTLFFEYQNLQKLTEFLLANYQTACVVWTGLGEEFAGAGSFSERKIADEEITPALHDSPNESGAVSHLATKRSQTREPIAIIGMSGRYPMSPSLAAYWENLKAGRDCISEIPIDRWRMDDFFESDKEHAIEKGRSYSKWGGFIEGFADFDPLFFNISPREANSMDPQERIFLQSCWQVFEDAGYTLDRVIEKFKGNVGVFAGVTKTGFELYNPELWKNGSDYRLRTSFSSVANRVSYHLNLSGPSVAIDTMCSASLTAVHEACENLLRNACEMAIAGGVNLYLHPLNYIDLCSQNFLAADGKCRSFGKDGSGFVPGEGVGTVLLKRLSQAIKDNDNIHAIIRGSDINHGGKTSGYTVPNPVSQSEIIQSTLDKAGIRARAVSYVEAHGTGTSLGDPIEITGLSKVFRADTADLQFCSIGSAKSNIGHLEAAAGIAGLAKVVLQMKHKMLVPSLHSVSINANINFEKSPFFVQQKLSSWKRPVMEQNGNSEEIPRIASISSFGAGGSNAHVIVEEYSVMDTDLEMNEQALPILIVLSARDEKALRSSANQLLEFISGDGFKLEHKDILNIAYTLQTGREAMEERLGIKIDSAKDLKEKLADYVSGKNELGYLYRGRACSKKESTKLAIDGVPLLSMIDFWVTNKNFDQVLSAWVKGCPVNWENLYVDASQTRRPPQRISLPTYPFEKVKYWPISLRANSGDAKENTPDLLVDSAAPGVSLSNVDKQWLFTKEIWNTDPLSAGIDWRKCLEEFLKKKICVVYGDEGDLAGLTGLLEKMERTAGLTLSRGLKTMNVTQIDAEVLKRIEPEVVLFLGPAQLTSSSPEPNETDLSYVFQLSKALMQAAWSERICIYYLFETSDSNARLDCEALSGFLRSAMKENDQHCWKSINIRNAENSGVRHQFFLQEWLSDAVIVSRDTEFREIRYSHGERFSKELIETKVNMNGTSAFRKNGNYLIAGGMGYIGGLLLEELAEKYQANLIIISKSPLDNARLAQCEKLKGLGATIYYHVGDIADMTTLAVLYNKVKKEVGAINGVINLARAHDSKGIVTKTWRSFYDVCQVKIAGTLNLDELTKDEALDVFMLFASIGAYGARGDSDYAFSVAFQNAFARHRDQLKKEGKRKGQTISQCWGPWVQDKLFPESRKKMKDIGLDLIDMKSAFPYVEASCSFPDPVLGLCAVVDVEKVKKVLHVRSFNSVAENPMDRFKQLVAEWEERKHAGEPVSISEIQKVISAEEIKTLDTFLIEKIYDLCFEASTRPAYAENLMASLQTEIVSDEDDGKSSVLKTGTSVRSIIRSAATEVLGIESLDESKSFQYYGLDSIMAMKLSMKLGKLLGMEILPQKFIDFPTVGELSQHIQTSLEAQYPREVENPGVDVMTVIRESVRAVLQIEELDDEKLLQEYGLDSIMAMRLSVSLEKKLKCEVKPNIFLEFSTVKELASHFRAINQHA